MTGDYTYIVRALQNLTDTIKSIDCSLKRLVKIMESNNKRTVIDFLDKPNNENIDPLVYMDDRIHLQPDNPFGGKKKDDGMEHGEKYRR